MSKDTKFFTPDLAASLSVKFRLTYLNSFDRNPMKPEERYLNDTNIAKKSQGVYLIRQQISRF
jgi:hypothetical protein